MANAKPNLRLRRIDIRDWGSEVARQFDIRRLPTIWLYKGTARVTEDSKAAFQQASRL